MKPAMKSTILVSIIAVSLWAAARFALLAQQPAATPPSFLPVPVQADPAAPSLTPPPVGAGPAPLPAPGQPPRAENPFTIHAAPPAANSYAVARGGVLFGSQIAPPTFSNAVPPLIFEFTPKGDEFGPAMEEDLAIMTRIFEQALEQTGRNPGISRLGIRFLMSDTSPSVRASYLEGFGANRRGPMPNNRRRLPIPSGRRPGAICAAERKPRAPVARRLWTDRNSIRSSSRP